MGMVTLPIYARVFPAAEYGALEIGVVTLAGLLIVADVGMATAMQRAYFQARPDDGEARSTVVSTALLASSALTVLMAALLIVLREPVAKLLFDSEFHARWVVLIAVALVPGVLAEFSRNVMRLRFDAWHYAASSILTVAFIGVGGVVGVLVFEGGVSAVLAAFVLAQVVGAIYGATVVRPELRIRFSRSCLGDLVTFGLPLMPVGLALWGIGFVDRVMLAQLDGLGAVGQYAVASRFSAVLMFAAVAFTTAYLPFTFSLHAEDPKAEAALRGGLLTYAAVLFAGCALAIGLAARELILVVAPGYDSAYRIAGLLCLGVAVFALSPIVSAGIVLTRRTRSMAIYATVALGFSLGTCLALIPVVGMLGAAVATAGSYVLLTLLYLRKSQQLARADFHLRKVAVVFLLAAALMPLGLVSSGSVFVDIAVRMAGLIGFVAGLWLVGVIGEIEQKEFRRLMASLRARGREEGAL